MWRPATSSRTAARSARTAPRRGRACSASVAATRYGSWWRPTPFPGRLRPAWPPKPAPHVRAASPAPVAPRAGRTFAFLVIWAVLVSGAAAPPSIARRAGKTPTWAAWPPSPDARTAPAAARNREPILAVLRAVLPDRRAGAGGRRAARASTPSACAAALPRIRAGGRATATPPPWPASPPGGQAAGRPNLRPPAPARRRRPGDLAGRAADAVVCINMIHISPWAATEGLMAGAGAGAAARRACCSSTAPTSRPTWQTAPSNLAFDASLKRARSGLGPARPRRGRGPGRRPRPEAAARVAMPANNLSLVFARG